MFTSAAASGILTNDLVSIMDSAHMTGIMADTVDDNIFQWNVKINVFNENSNLDSDFRELEKKFGYDYIELQLDFSMDLYPFFPPLVKVIRPRLQGSMMLRVTTMEILKLSYWNPARNMKSVLVDIKMFLQTWARLDLTSERNDRSRYVDGAYIDIEHHLLRLALVSEMVPRANKKYISTITPPKQNLPPSAMEATMKATVGSTTRSSTSSGYSIPLKLSSDLKKASSNMVLWATSKQAAKLTQAKSSGSLATAATAEKSPEKPVEKSPVGKSSSGGKSSVKGPVGGKAASPASAVASAAAAVATVSGGASGSVEGTSVSDHTAKKKELLVKKGLFPMFASLAGGSKNSGGAGSGSGSGGGGGSATATLQPLNPLHQYVFAATAKKDDGSEKSSKKCAFLGPAKNMAKGVGYSSYQQKGWDVKAYMAAQKEKDNQIELVLEKIYQELKKLHGSHQMNQRNLPDVITGEFLIQFGPASRICLTNQIKLTKYFLAIF